MVLDCALKMVMIVYLIVCVFYYKKSEKMGGKTYAFKVHRVPPISIERFKSPLYHSPNEESDLTTPCLRFFLAIKFVTLNW